MAIYGMGGIGKTTIAKFVYNLNFSKFEGSSFLADVREISGQRNGLIRLQRQLLSDILRRRKEKINNIAEGIVKIQEAIGSKRVLIVLDDVDKREQLDAILGMREWLFPGSKIIITARHEGLLRSHEYFRVQRVKELDLDESLELLSLYAFGQNHPFDGYLVESKKLVDYCRGLPLGIKTLASSLYGKSPNVWSSQLQKLEATPVSEVLEKLKLSYYSLQDDHDRSLFLDIACFFVGKDKDYTITILNGCHYHSLIGIENLVERNLLTIDKHNMLVMHPLIQEMAREIVREESPIELGKRSRLWKHLESFHVLREETGTRKIRGLVLDTHFLKEDKSEWNLFGPHLEICSKKRKRFQFSIFSDLLVGTSTKNSNVVFEVDAFSRMSNLQLLQIGGVQLCGNYENFPKGLRWLCWSYFPLQMMPNDFPLDRLVALEMPHSSLKKVLNGTKCLRLLKILNLSHSKNLSVTPDFSKLPNLERLILKSCTRLVKIDKSIGQLEKLIFLSLKDCQNLRKIPKTICRLKSLATLDISDCLNLRNIPELENMDSLTVLLADGTVVNQLLSRTREVKPWHFSLWPWQLTPMRSPEISWISFPSSLVHLSLENCNLYDDSFPREFGNLPSLRALNLSRNQICGLPSCVKNLPGLQVLWLVSCPRLKSLDGLSKDLKILVTESSKAMEKISFECLDFPQTSLDCAFCTSLTEIVGVFKLEPLESADLELINKLGLCNFEALEKPHVELVSMTLFERKMTFPPQVMHEPHGFYTYLQESKIPMRFDLKKIGSSISFTLPSDVNIRIQGLSVCSVYALSDTTNSSASHFRWDTWGLHTIISNVTKNLKWSYCPYFTGIPRANEDLIWLSYWKFEDQLLEGGDELNISIVTNDIFQVKEVGVRLVYKEAEEEKGTELSTSLQVVREIHPYGKAVPGCCNEDCKYCKKYPPLTNPASTRVIPLGLHPRNCTGCPDGHLVFHHARWRGPFHP